MDDPQYRGGLRMGRKRMWPPPVYEKDGVARVRIYHGPRQFTERTLGPAGSEIAKREYARVIAEIEAGAARSRQPDVTVAELVADYLEEQAREREPREYRRTHLALSTVAELYGHTIARDFGPVALKTVRAKWITAGYARTYCNDLAGEVRKWSRWCVANEHLPVECAERLKLLQPLLRQKAGKPGPVLRENPEVEAVPIEHVLSTLPHLTNLVADMVRVQLLLGCRPGEICAMAPVDLDRHWRVIEGVQIWLYNLDEHKTRWRGHRRQIAVGPRAQLILADYLEGEYCFSPARSAREYCERVGRTYREGKGREHRPCYHPCSYARAVAKACARGGVPHWSPNQLRHTAATQIEVEYGREDARCVLGHSTPTTTAIYAEWVERAAVVAAKRG